MYYYGARYYDPRISIFVSSDPLVEKTRTPYQYVGNNPVNMIDPTGMKHHDYKLNRNGNLDLVKKTDDKYDRIFNEKGDDGIVVSKGFIDMSHEISDNKGQKSRVYPMSSSDVKYGDGKEIFKFFANNTEKEYSYSEFRNSKTGNKFGFLITSQKTRSIFGVGQMISNYLNQDKNNLLIYNVHSHPLEYDPEWYHMGTTPSGFAQNSKLNTILTAVRDSRTKEPIGDRAVYILLKEKYGNRIPSYFNLYTPSASHINVRYNDKTAIRKGN